MLRTYENHRTGRGKSFYKFIFKNRYIIMKINNKILFSESTVYSHLSKSFKNLSI